MSFRSPNVAHSESYCISPHVLWKLTESMGFKTDPCSVTGGSGNHRCSWTHSVDPRPPNLKPTEAQTKNPIHTTPLSTVTIIRGTITSIGRGENRGMKASGMDFSFIGISTSLGPLPWMWFISFLPFLGVLLQVCLSIEGTSFSIMCFGFFLWETQHPQAFFRIQPWGPDPDFWPRSF